MRKTLNQFLDSKYFEATQILYSKPKAAGPNMEKRKHA
jgi:hypothetical protein